MRYYLREDILTKVDIASMRTSLETRPPFVDPKVWDWANQIPHEYLYDANTSPSGFEGKKLLKSLLLDLFPSEFIHRPKMGFGIPLNEWLNNGALTDAYQRALFSESSSLKNILHIQKIRKWHGTQAETGVFETSGQWVLLVLNTWLGQWERERGLNDYV
jgi:asparagine synthase (glutamine-hydrolysing)